MCGDCGFEDTCGRHDCRWRSDLVELKMTISSSVPRLWFPRPLTFVWVAMMATRLSGNSRVSEVPNEVGTTKAGFNNDKQELDRLQ